MGNTNLTMIKKGNKVKNVSGSTISATDQLTDLHSHDQG